MKTWTTTTALGAVLFTTALACALGGASALADDKKPYPRPGGGSGAPSASAMAPPPEEAPKIADGHPPRLLTLDVDVPVAASEPPAKDDWASAPPASNVRVTDPGCKAQRIREWYRFTCNYTLIEMISGGIEGVSFGCRKTSSESFMCDEGWVIFPVRRGDRRAVEFFTQSKWGLQPDTILTEQFQEGDPYPLISLQGLRWDF